MDGKTNWYLQPDGAIAADSEKAASFVLVSTAGENQCKVQVKGEASKFLQIAENGALSIGEDGNAYLHEDKGGYDGGSEKVTSISGNEKVALVVEKEVIRKFTADNSQVAVLAELTPATVKGKT